MYDVIQAADIIVAYIERINVGKLAFVQLYFRLATFSYKNLWEKFVKVSSSRFQYRNIILNILRLNLRAILINRFTSGLVGWI